MLSFVNCTGLSVLNCLHPAMASFYLHPNMETQDLWHVLHVSLLDSHWSLWNIMHIHLNMIQQFVSMVYTLMSPTWQLATPYGAFYYTLNLPSILDCATDFHMAYEDKAIQDTMDALAPPPDHRALVLGLCHQHWLVGSDCLGHVG